MLMGITIKQIKKMGRKNSNGGWGWEGIKDKVEVMNL
jgi:hypothetical protein